MWEVRSIDKEEVDLFRARMSRAFGRDPDSGEDSRQRFGELVDLDRTVAVFDGEQLIGTGGAFSFEVTVPGGASLPMAGTSLVTVQPTHRRRGALTAIMTHHLADVAARGEPLAGLWASESAIYGRFGYGPASYRHQVELDAAAVSVRGGLASGTVRLVEPEEAAPLLRSVYEQVRPAVAGMLTRSDQWWSHRRMRDFDPGEGKSGRRYAVYEEEERALGYATYRQKPEWGHQVAVGELKVEEMVVSVSQAHRALWGFLTNVDLFPKVEFWNMPVDDPLPQILTDPRRARTDVSDGMWLRLIDVPRALESRSYQWDGVLVLDVADRFFTDAAGVYRLEVDDGEARCERSDDEPDVSCDIDVLGHLYLGGGNALAMASAGRLQGSPLAVQRLHRMFRTDRAPWCPEVF